MKKILLIASLLGFVAASQAQQVLVTNVNYTASGVYPVFTNRVNLLSVSLVSPNNNTLVEFFNAVTNAPYNGTNKVVPAYTSKGTAQSNVVTSYIQADTGITNWYTNAGLFTYLVTNSAATSALAPSAVFIGGSQPITYQTSALLEKGLSIRTSTNANVVIYYNYGQ